MGQPTHVRMKEERAACFLASYHDIRDNNVHDDLQKVSSTSGGHGIVNTASSCHFHVMIHPCLHVELHLYVC
jgi:hypothetical protein